jgi:hypothetical protein
VNRVMGSCVSVPTDTSAPGAAGATSIEVWPYTQDTRVPWRTRIAWLVDPINLLFLDTDTAALMEALGQVGWRRPRIGAAHRAWIDGRPMRMSDDAALGPNHERFHVRFWDAPAGLVVGAAHREVEGRRVEHVVTSWDAARAKVIADLCSLGWERGRPTPLIAAPNLRGLPGDGRAWRVGLSDRAPTGKTTGRPTAIERV